MALDARLESLREKHRRLELELTEESRRPMPDPKRIKQLKQEKLSLKDEINQFQAA